MYNSKMKISHIKLFSLPVTNQDIAKDFYVNKLGFKLVRDNPMGPNQRWVEVKPENAETSITLVTWFDTMKPGTTKGIVLETTNLEDDVDALKKNGIEIEGGIQEQPWGKFVTLNDPDGNGIVLQSTSPDA